MTYSISHPLLNYCRAVTTRFFSDERWFYFAQEFLFGFEKQQNDALLKSDPLSFQSAHIW